MLFKLTLKAFKERESISSPSCKACYYLIIIKSADFTSITLHNGISKTDLPVSANNNLAVAPY
jgi:hypothetical protein